MATDGEQSAAPAQRGWFARNRSWFLPTVIILPLLACGGCCGGLFITGWWGVRAIKTSEPYQMALEKVQQSPQVIERLGEPIEDASFAPTGGVHQQMHRDSDGAHTTGNAVMYFEVAGPRGKAQVSAQAIIIEEEWEITALTVTFPEGGSVELSSEQADSPHGAPAFVPGEVNAAPPAESAPPSVQIEIEAPDAP